MSIDLNKFTVKGQEAIQNSIEIAQNYNNQIVELQKIVYENGAHILKVDGDYLLALAVNTR